MTGIGCSHAIFFGKRTTRGTIDRGRAAVIVEQIGDFKQQTIPAIHTLEAGGIIVAIENDRW